MKKLILFILLFLFGICNIYAKTYYSKYTDFSEYSENEIQSSDTVLVEKTKFYHAYKETYNNSYLLNSIYEKTGLEYNEYLNWTDNINNIDKNLKYETCIKTNYIPFKKYEYYIVKNLSEKVTVNFFGVGSRKIGGYTMQQENFNMYTNDGLIIPNNEKEDLNDIYFTIELEKGTNRYLKYALYGSNDGYSFRESTLIQEIEDNSYNQIMTIQFGDYSNNPSILQNKIESVYCDTYTGFNEVSKQEVYRNYNTYYEYKIPQKEYIDLYLEEEPPEYKIDLDDYKYMYRYKTRDKVVVPDEILVEQKDFDINKIVTDSTVEDIKITSNLDLNINGTYQINFITPFNVITKDIKVDIKENYVEALKAQNEYNNYLLEKAQEANYSVDKKNLEIKEIIVSNEEEINSLKKELNNSNNKILNGITTNKLKEVKETKKQTINIFVLLISLTSIFVINRLLVIINGKKS